MKSMIVKRSVIINGRKTSISLEDAFWHRLKDIARAQQTTLSKILGEIAEQRHQGNLSSSIRLFVLDQACIQLSKFSENRAGMDMIGEARETTRSGTYGR